MAQQYELKDSGNRRVFETGAQRDRAAGKGRYDLLSPLSIRRLADIFEKGAAKYADRNWEKGMPISQFIDSGLRHAFQYLEGKRDEDHLGQAAWNFMAAIHTEEAIERGLLPKSLNNLPNYIPKPTALDEVLKKLNQLPGIRVAAAKVNIGDMLPAERKSFEASMKKMGAVKLEGKDIAKEVADHLKKHPLKPKKAVVKKKK